MIDNYIHQGKFCKNYQYRYKSKENENVILQDLALNEPYEKKIEIRKCIYYNSNKGNFEPYKEEKYFWLNETSCYKTTFEGEFKNGKYYKGKEYLKDKEYFPFIYGHLRYTRTYENGRIINSN